MKNKLWIVGQIHHSATPQLWEFQGVFSTKDLAVKACITENYFTGPATLDMPLPEETMSEWPGCVYPLLSESQ